jgi:hypothetical protein
MLEMRVQAIRIKNTREMLRKILWKYPIRAKATAGEDNDALLWVTGRVRYSGCPKYSEYPRISANILNPHRGFQPPLPEAGVFTG